jgi:hypothetical protein
VLIVGKSGCVLVGSVSGGEEGMVKSNTELTKDFAATTNNKNSHKTNSKDAS